MRKLLLKCGLSPGDIVMLTAAVRDLHLYYPNQFATDVRTHCPELWDNNPCLTPLSEEDPEVEIIECSYPLIDRCNDAPYHCLHGFIEFLNDRLRLAIKPTAFKGDIHLSPQEKAWYSQVHEVTGEDTPFWIVAAGGKYDVTIKWWATERYQAVIDHFKGRIQFVQIGKHNHHHPRLEGAIDLRGQTSLRELIRLVYHSQGVLCSITALMHLAAAVESRPGESGSRPCVVVGGGREPAYWEAYPGHQFIHTNGALPCCARGGCWRDRTFALRDGDNRDRAGQRCVDVVNLLPHCLEMITPAEVIRRVELYFQGDARKYLSPGQVKASQRGLLATAKSSYDRQPLNLHNAGMACDGFIPSIPDYPNRYEGRGIVICGGGIRYFTNAWVCINRLRRLGCRLPIELWHIGKQELDSRMRSLLSPLGVRCIDAHTLRRRFPIRILGGWQLKPYAILHSSFHEVLLLDADNVPVVNPEFLFDTAQFQATGAIFWPDYNHADNGKLMAIWHSCGMRPPKEREFETGQILVNKRRCWRALCLTLWFNENSDFYYQYLHGDKETFHLAFRKLKKSYSLIRKPIHPLPGVMCQHDFKGRRIFQHRNTDKWDLFLHNKQVEDFWFEDECRQHLIDLRRVWDGRIGSVFQPRNKTGPQRRSVRIAAILFWRPDRKALRAQTLENLAETDWAAEPSLVRIPGGEKERDGENAMPVENSALEAALSENPDYLLLLKDDLDFNRHLRHNLERWKALRGHHVAIASLYNPMVRELACDLNGNARLVHPRSAFGAQALLLSKQLVEGLLRKSKKALGDWEITIPGIASRLGAPVFYHAPSLVQCISGKGSPGASRNRAMDFDPGWKA